jgi:hypothetical protein
MKDLTLIGSLQSIETLQELIPLIQQYKHLQPGYFARAAFEMVVVAMMRPNSPRPASWPALHSTARSASIR